MRGLATVVLTIFVSVPAFAGTGLLHDRIPVPPPSPAFASSGGDPYGRFAKDYGPPERETELQRLATSIGAGRSNGHTDVFNYSLQHDDDGNAVPGAALAGTVSGGAALLQLRWTSQ